MKTHHTQTMRGLWRHLLRDCSSRAWLVIAGGSVLFVSSFCLDILEDVPAGGTSGIVAALFVLIFGSAYAITQYPTYPLLAALPVSRAIRGRLVWFQHVAVMPALYFVEVAVLAALVAPLRGWPLSFLHVAIASGAIVPPALMLLVWRRPPLKAPFYLQVAFYTPIGFLAWSLYIKTILGDELTIPSWYVPALLVACIVVVAASYVMAPRFMVGPVVRRKVVGRVPSRPRAGSTFYPRRGGIGPLRRMALFEPLRFPPFILMIFFFAMIQRDSQGLMLSVFAGLLASTAFARGGRLAAENARLMRALPITPGKLAATVMAYGVAGAIYVTIAAAFLKTVLLPDVSPLVLGNAILLGVCLGAFAPAFFLRCSYNSPLGAVYGGAVVLLMMLNLLFPWITIPALLPLLAIAAPLCVIIATLLLREVLLYDTAYQYRKPPLQAMSEGL